MSLKDLAVAICFNINICSLILKFRDKLQKCPYHVVQGHKCVNCPCCVCMWIRHGTLSRRKWGVCCWDRREEAKHPCEPEEQRILFPLDCACMCLWVLALFAFCFCLNMNPVRPVSFGCGTSEMHAKPNSKHTFLWQINIWLMSCWGGLIGIY